MARIGLRFCGGCNPSYDRVAYVIRIREAAAGRVCWPAPETGDCSVLLIVNGCERGCAEEETARNSPGQRIVSVKSDEKSPAEIVYLLLEPQEPVDAGGGLHRPPHE